MNEAVVSTPVIDAPLSTGAEVIESEPLSMVEHAKLYGETKAATPEGEKAALQEKAAHHSAEQKRERETGKFEPGRVRHRAEKDKAGPQDVPRIRELTGKLRSTEEQLTAAQAELTKLRTSATATPAQVTRAETKVEQATAAVVTAPADDPEPKEDDPQFGGDYAKYLRAVQKWDVREALRADKAAQVAEARKADVHAAHQKTLSSWNERVTAAKAKYPNFEAVAFAPTRIPDGSIPDTWIMEHRSGADVLYYLQSHADELDSLLRMPVLDQVEHLTLLSQRLLPVSGAQAGTTGAAASRPLATLPTKPPTPVRTEAQRTGSDPAPMDGSLSVTGHAKAFYKR